MYKYIILLLTISIISISCNGKEINNIIVQTNKADISNNNNRDDIKVSTSKLTSKENYAVTYYLNLMLNLIQVQVGLVLMMRLQKT